MPSPQQSAAKNGTSASEQTTKSRFNARISEQQRAIIGRAASLTGQTVSQFIVSSAQRAAEETIREYEVISLSTRDSIAVMEALLSPPQANEALRRAFEHHRELIGED